MGTSHGDFVKYPSTPHIFSEKKSAKRKDDKYLDEKASQEFLQNHLIIEEKLDGTNTGIRFTKKLDMVLQCRGHLITEGMHAQYDLFKSWTRSNVDMLFDIIGTRYIMYGEWVYAEHNIHYDKLPHYFFEFDIWDIESDCFLNTNRRCELLDNSGVLSVPVIFEGEITKKEELDNLITQSLYSTSLLAEGLYLKAENERDTIGRAKYVRTEFIQEIEDSEHWQNRTVIQNGLAEGISIWDR